MSDDRRSAFGSRVTKGFLIIFFFLPIFLVVIVHDLEDCNGLHSWTIGRFLRCNALNERASYLHASWLPWLWKPKPVNIEEYEERHGKVGDLRKEISAFNAVSRARATVRLWEFAAIAQSVLVSIVTLWETRRLNVPRSGTNRGAAALLGFVGQILILILGVGMFIFLARGYEWQYQGLLILTVLLFLTCDLVSRGAFRKQAKRLRKDLTEFQCAITRDASDPCTRELLVRKLTEVREELDDSNGEEDYFRRLVQFVDVPTISALLVICLYAGVPLPDHNASFFSGAIAVQLIFANMLIVLLRMTARPL